MTRISSLFGGKQALAKEGHSTRSQEVKNGACRKKAIEISGGNVCTEACVDSNEATYVDIKNTLFANNKASSGGGIDVGYDCLSAGSWLRAVCWLLAEIPPLPYPHHPHITHL